MLEELLSAKIDRDSLSFVLLDRLGLGVLLLLVGAAFSYILELIKIRLAVKIEASKQRVARVGEVWSAVYESEAASRTLIHEALGALERDDDVGALRAALMPLEEQSKAKAERVRQAAEENRFWLNDSVYRRVQNVFV